jgi:hypothetical protein
MTTKPIEFPKKLLQIPCPWNITSDRERRQEQEKLDRTEGNFENALSSIEIALAVFQNLVFLEKTSIPEESLTSGKAGGLEMGTAQRRIKLPLI